jgi:hypothetical protein
MKYYTLPQTTLATDWTLCAHFHGLTLENHPMLTICLHSGQNIEAILN